METVRLNKTEVLARLRGNKDTHESLFQDALKGYRETIKHKISELLKKAEKEEDVNLNHLFNTNKPTSHSKDYARAIRMLEMSVDDVIELTEREFSQFILDDWAWQREWLGSNSVYSSSSFSSKIQEINAIGD